MTEDRLFITAVSLINLAKDFGLSQTNSVVLPLICGVGKNSFTRQVTISEVNPGIEANSVNLWLHPIQRVFKQQTSSGYVEVADYETLIRFPDTRAANSGGTNVTVDGQIFTSSSTPIWQQGQTVNDLRAVSTSQLADGTLMYIDENHTLYSYDKEATETASSGLVVPVSGLGRWYPLSVTNQIFNSGTF